MNEPSYPGINIVQVLIWFRMVLTHITIRYIQRFAHSDIPTRFQYLTGTTILICSVGFLIPLLVLIIDTHAVHLEYQTHTSPYPLLRNELVRLTCELIICPGVKWFLIHATFHMCISNAWWKFYNHILINVVVVGSLQVAPHKKVRKVEFIEAIPKSGAGKILRKELIARHKQWQRFPKPLILTRQTLLYIKYINLSQ